MVRDRSVAGDGSNFPIAAESRRLVSGLVALGPFVIAVVALFAFKSIRAIMRQRRAPGSLAVQTYRVAGIMFVFPFLTYGIVPAGFGWPAGIGDALTGIFAPVVALMVARNRPNCSQMGGGLESFRHARPDCRPSHRALLPVEVLAIYPLALVPLFLGPPLGILTHIWSFRNFGGREAARTGTRVIPSIRRSAAIRFFARRAASMTSLPTPSPGIHAISYLAI